MIDALALAAGVLDEPRYLAAATAAAEFHSDQLRRDDGRLLHSWRTRRRRSSTPISTTMPAWPTRWSRCTKPTSTSAGSTRRCGLADTMLALFRRSPHGGGFFYTANDHEQLIARHERSVRQRHAQRQRAGRLWSAATGQADRPRDYLAAAEATIAAAAAVMQQSPTAAGQMLLALDMQLGPTPEIVILGDPNSSDTAATLSDLRQRSCRTRSWRCAQLHRLLLQLAMRWPACSPARCRKAPSRPCSSVKALRARRRSSDGMP